MAPHPQTPQPIGGGAAQPWPVLAPGSEADCWSQGHEHSKPNPAEVEGGC